jgi:hypothetical protein
VLTPAAWVNVNTDVTDAYITVDLGWTSTSSPTLGNSDGSSIWLRQANLGMTLDPQGTQAGSGTATVNIFDSGPGTQLSAIGFDGYGTFFQIFSTAAEDSVVGTLGVGPSETAVRTLAFATATFTGGDPSFTSTLNGNMTGFGGQGGFGGAGGGHDGGPGQDGGVAPWGFVGGGAFGGGGGPGGPLPMPGGDGGAGGDGGYTYGFASGFYQGSIAVYVEQL